jgi:hypothetical protein
MGLSDYDKNINCSRILACRYIILLENKTYDTLSFDDRLAKQLL